jgi:hypothetical protein
MIPAVSSQRAGRSTRMAAGIASASAITIGPVAPRQLGPLSGPHRPRAGSAVRGPAGAAPLAGLPQDGQQLSALVLIDAVQVHQREALRPLLRVIQAVQGRAVLASALRDIFLGQPRRLAELPELSSQAAQPYRGHRAAAGHASEFNEAANASDAFTLLFSHP